MSENSSNICVINAKSGIGTSSPQISQFSHNCDCIKFIVEKNLTNCAVIVITSIDGNVSVINEGGALKKSYDESLKQTTLLWYPQSVITHQSGCVVYQIAAYDAQDEKNYIWYSKEGRLIVTDSIDTTDYSTNLIGTQPNLITQLITNCKSLELSVENALQNTVDKSEFLNHCNDLLEYQNEIHKGETSYNSKSDLAQSGKAVAEAIAGLANTSPETLERLEELAEMLENDFDSATSIISLLGQKVDKVDGKMLSSNDFTSFYMNQILTNAQNIGLAQEKITDIEELVFQTPITSIPLTLNVNSQYNFGEVSDLQLVFPSVANDGDAIYISFSSGDEETNLSIDTTNTCDIEIIPEVNTGYEIFGKYNGSIWIINYSEYTVSEG